MFHFRKSCPDGTWMSCREALHSLFSVLVITTSQRKDLCLKYFPHIVLFYQASATGDYCVNNALKGRDPRLPISLEDDQLYDFILHECREREIHIWCQNQHPAVLMPL